MQDPAGFPPHSLRLKIGMPVMAIRNLSPSQGIANGTRMVIEKLLPYTIKVKLLTGARAGSIVMIPRTTFISKDNELPFKLQRRQYPIKPAWAMTINKAQVRPTPCLLTVDLPYIHLHHTPHGTIPGCCILMLYPITSAVVCRAKLSRLSAYTYEDQSFHTGNCTLHSRVAGRVQASRS